MTAITLPRAFEEWAVAEVQAGRAESVEALALRLLDRERLGWEALRAKLDAAEAEAERDGWIDADVVFAELDAILAEVDDA